MSNNAPSQLGISSAKIRYQQPGDVQLQLYYLVKDYTSNRMCVPEFQRDKNAWDSTKRRQYVEALESGSPPIGVIVTCQIEGDETLWLLDGLQRLSTLHDLLTVPKNYGHTKESAEALLLSVNVTRQHRNYQSMDEALRWFQRINLGTQLTNYEFYKGYLEILPDYQKVIKPELQKVHDAVDQARSSLGIKKSTRRNESHKFLQHNFLLFYRFCTEDQGLTPVEMSSSKKQKDNRVVEKLLTEWIRHGGVQVLRKKSASFASIVTNHAALIHDLWPRIYTEDRNRTINETFYRWLLEIEIYRRTLNRSQSDYEQFLKQLWTLWSAGSNTVARIPAASEGGRSLIVQLGKAPYQISVLSKQLGSDFAEKKIRQSRKSQIVEARLGMHEDHYDQPFATHGEGPTRAEPAGRNMARGAQVPETK